MWDKIKKLYSLYGFKLDDENDWYVVYIYEQGYFNNAEIIIKDTGKKEKIEKLIDNYSKSGYSVSVKEGMTYEKLKGDLFNGFFRIQQSKRRVAEEYKKYTENQKARLGGIDYSYITSKYTVDGKMYDDGNILGVIYECLNDKKRNLVILEAPAGFGKTCTSYEVSKMLADDDSQRIPMMTELSKNRRASIFRYVLLSEIDAKFNLKYPLVETQIKNGKIPLIIDGFDELLSRNVKGEEDTDDAVTMLETISELLRDDSKASILLTSRKSSIFAGDIFDSWAENNIKDCKLTRIQILAPTIQDWLDKDKRSFFDEREINLKNVHKFARECYNR